MTAATIAATRAFAATRLLFAAAGAFTRLLFAAGGFLLAARRFFATRRLAAVVVMPVASPVATPGIRLRLKPDQNDGQRRHSERHTKHNSLHQRSSKKQGPSFGTFVPFTDAHGTMEDRIARCVLAAKASLHTAMTHSTPCLDLSDHRNPPRARCRRICLQADAHI
jgi:hypothetical protein